MSTPLAQDKTSATLAATDDRLRREMSELQKLREAVAEAERCNLDRQQRAEPRPVSCRPARACPSSARQRASAASSRDQPRSPMDELDCETSAAQADKDA